MDTQVNDVRTPSPLAVLHCNSTKAGGVDSILAKLYNSALPSVAAKHADIHTPASNSKPGCTHLQTHTKAKSVLHKSDGESARKPSYDATINSWTIDAVRSMLPGGVMDCDKLMAAAVRLAG